MKAVISLSALVLFILVGCVSMEERRQQDNLEERTKQYEAAILWGKYDIAKAFISGDIKGAAVAAPDTLKNIKVTSYKVIDRHIVGKGVEARQTVEIRFYNVTNLIEKTTLDNQKWYYDGNLKNWFLSSGLPDFR